MATPDQDDTAPPGEVTAGGAGGGSGAPEPGVTEPPIPAAEVDRRKQVIAGVVTLVVLVIVFVGIFPQFANYRDAWESIKQMSIAAALALLAVTVLNVAVYVLPYQAAMPHLPYGQAFVVRQTSFMISNVVPAGGAFGLGVQYSMLSGYGYGPAATTSAIAATSVWNLLVTLALPVLGVVALAVQGGASSEEVVAALVGVGLLVMLVGVFALVLRNERAARWLGGLGDRFVDAFHHLRHRSDDGRSDDAESGTVGPDDREPDDLGPDDLGPDDLGPDDGGPDDGGPDDLGPDDLGPDDGGPDDGGPDDREPDPAEASGSVTASLLSFRTTLNAVVADRWGRLTSTSTAQQLCQFLILAVAYFGITGSGGGINPAELFAAFAIGRLASFIPVTPGGLGTVDAAIVALMVTMGADQEEALAAVLLWRAASYFPQVIIGVVTFLVWRRHAHRRDMAPAGADR